VDVVGEEDCTDMKTEEVYRPSDLSIKTEYAVSIVIKCFCGVYLCVCVCVCVCFIPCCVWADNFTCVKQILLLSSGGQQNYQDVDIYNREYAIPWPVSLSQQH
jgi:hypothetical protein